MTRLTRLRPVALGALIGLALTVALSLSLRPPLAELTAQRMRAAVAIVSLVLTAWEARRRASARPLRPALVHGSLGAIAVVAIGAYHGFMSPVDARLVHRHDVFHYYMGSKYAEELSYTRIYACSALADVELGHGREVRANRIRDLNDDRVVTGAELLADPAKACLDHFTPERWASFVRDVRLFREQIEPLAWRTIHVDHGYNPPPAWSLVGGAIGSLAPPTASWLRVLVALDLLLYLGLFAAIGWAFGLRVTVLAIVFWACQDPANQSWLGGAFLRIDWFFAVVIGVCALARRRHALGGAALAAATLLRLFPAVLFAGPLVVIAARAIRERRLTRAHARFLLGAAGAAAIIFGLTVASLGARSYREFADHIRVHASMPAANQMGVKPLLMHDLDGSQDRLVDLTKEDPAAPWRRARIVRYDRLAPIHYATVLAAAAALVYVMSRRRALWVGAVLSLPLLFAALPMGCYYVIVFVTAPLLARVSPRVERLSLWTAAASAVLVTMPALSSIPNDEFATQSLVYVVFSCGLFVLTWPRSRRAALASG